MMSLEGWVCNFACFFELSEFIEVLRWNFVKTNNFFNFYFIIELKYFNIGNFAFIDWKEKTKNF